MKVEIIEGCIGCENCVSICSDVFQINEEGKAVVVKQPDSNEENMVYESAESCPVNVIMVE